MRITSRSFLDANQLGMTGTVLLAQSRITFSGSRGRVLILWRALFNNPGAALVNTVSLQIIGTALAAGFSQIGINNIVAAIGADAETNALALLTDPPDGSFVEVQVAAGAFTVDLSAGSGRIWAVSMPPSVDDGPVMTVL